MQRQGPRARQLVHLGGRREPVDAPARVQTSRYQPGTRRVCVARPRRECLRPLAHRGPRSVARLVRRRPPRVQRPIAGCQSVARARHDARVGARRVRPHAASDRAAGARLAGVARRRRADVRRRAALLRTLGRWEIHDGLRARADGLDAACRRSGRLAASRRPPEGAGPALQATPASGLARALRGQNLSALAVADLARPHSDGRDLPSRAADRRRAGVDLARGARAGVLGPAAPRPLLRSQRRRRDARVH